MQMPMMSESNSAYAKLLDHVREANLLGSTGSLLGWDQEAMMPGGGASFEYRSRQLAQLASIAHRMETDPRIGEWLDACEGDAELTADPLSASAVNLREVRREYDRATKLPGELVEEFSRTAALAKHAWSEARGRDDYATFRPWLEKLLELNRRRAECWGWGESGEPWDALAEGFEPGMTAAGVERVFAPLRGSLVELVADLTENGTPPAAALSDTAVPVDRQEAFVRHVAAEVGFDFSRGRLDRSAHPFCGGTNRDDVRMTTRYHPSDPLDGLSSTLHESGHGIYQQNLPGGEHADTPMGQPVGLSIHESQSRMIENQLGRSRAFWAWCQPKLGQFLSPQLGRLSLDEVYAALNRVQPSLIRVEADEATYNLHIMVRFELERAMMRGDLSPADLPAAWNEKYRAYLGVDVPSDADGCMQDIHWSMGAMGYFPTYTMGNLYAAQFFEQARADAPDLYERFERGDFTALTGWLAEHIHSQGMRYRSDDLCEHVTGKPLSAEPLMRHLNEKLRPVYGL